MPKRPRLLESVLKYLTAGVVLSVPLFPKFPFIKIPGTFVSIRLEDFILAITFAVLIFYIYHKKQLLLNYRLMKAILLFLLTGLVSLFSAILITRTVVPHIGLLHWARRIEYFIPLLLGFAVIKMDRDNLHFYFKLLTIVTFISFIFGIGQRYFNLPIIITQNQEYSKGIALRWVPGSHINATFAGHYDLATFLVMVLPVFITSFFILKDLRSRFIILVTVLAGLWLMVNTASRISLASYLLASVAALVFVRKYWAVPIVVITSIIFIFFSSNLQARYQRLYDVTKENIQKILNVYVVNNVMAQEINSLPQRRDKGTPVPTTMPVFEDRSTSIRLNVEWPRALRAFKKNPILGTGYSSITLATDNDFLRLIGEVGAAGLLSFMLVVARVLMPFFSVFPFVKHFKGAELCFVAGISGAFIGLWLNAMFIDIFEASKFAILFWFSVGMALSLIMSVRNEKLN